MSFRRWCCSSPTSSIKPTVSAWRGFRPLPSYLSMVPSLSVQPRLRPCHCRRLITRHASTNTTKAFEHNGGILKDVRGQSGRIYKVDSILQDRGPSLGRVYLAVAGDKRYILKEVPCHNYDRRKRIYDRLGPTPYVRGLADTVPGHSMFVFDYLSHNFLGLVQQGIGLATTKQILKCALQGLAAMHTKDIVHNDIKPNNIFIAASEGSDGWTIHQTVLADLEDSAYCPPPGNLIGAQLGNWMWRSPEAHAGGPMNKPSDIFSFAIVCIYATTTQVIFHVSQDELGEGEELLAIVLERQLSYFGDADTFAGFLEYLANTDPNNPWIEIFQVVWTGFNAENPREPFVLWGKDPPFDEDFRDLILKMTCFDPRRRITAREALEHDWFKDV